MTYYLPSLTQFVVYLDYRNDIPLNVFCVFCLCLQSIEKNLFQDQKNFYLSNGKNLITLGYRSAKIEEFSLRGYAVFFDRADAQSSILIDWVGSADRFEFSLQNYLIQTNGSVNFILSIGVLQLNRFELAQMYGKINQRKLKEEDYIMSCQKVREELEAYINDQSKRVNIDSAKKRAVLQHMDYEGFRQMVLGANIFPTKSQELYAFSKGNQKTLEQDQSGLHPQNNSKVILNKAATKKQSVTQGIQTKLASGNSQKQCNNFRDFKKKFMKFYDKELNQQIATQLYNLVKQQNEQRLSKIFNMECQTAILAKISHLFSFVIKYLQSNNKQLLPNQLSFMAKFFQTIIRIPTMTNFSMNILTKNQKNQIRELLEQIRKLIDQQDFQDVNQIIKSIK